MGFALRSSVVIIAILFVAAFALRAQPLDGTYIVKASNAAVLLELHETQHERIDGDYRAIILNDDGTLSFSQSKIMGLPIGWQGNLTFVDVQPPYKMKNVNVDFNGITLVLSYDANDGSSATQKLQPGSHDDFAEWSRRLEKESEQILAAKAAAERQRGFGDYTVGALQSLNDRITSVLHDMSVENARRNLNHAGQLFEDEYKAVSDALTHLQDIANSEKTERQTASASNDER